MLLSLIYWHRFSDELSELLLEVIDTRDSNKTISRCILLSCNIFHVWKYPQLLSEFSISLFHNEFGVCKETWRAPK